MRATTTFNSRCPIIQDSHLMISLFQKGIRILRLDTLKSIENSLLTTLICFHKEAKKAILILFPIRYEEKRLWNMDIMNRRFMILKKRLKQIQPILFLI